MLKTKEEIKSWLNQYNIKKYTINDDLSVDVDGNVNLSNKQLTEIPIQFGIVSDDVYFENNELISLKGCPKEIGGDFYCYNNKLTSLEGCPEKIFGDFDFSKNNIDIYNEELNFECDGFIALIINEKTLKLTKFNNNLTTYGKIIIELNLLKEIINDIKNV